MKKGTKFNVKEIAVERVEKLFEQASKEFKSYPERSHRYVKLALRVVAKSGIRVPRKFRRRYCRKCKKYLVSGVNAKIRTRDGKLIVSCLECGACRRMILKTKI